MAELERLGIEVPDVAGDRVLFLVERSRVAHVRATVDGFAAIAGVRSVSLTYFSVEDDPPS